ncbi:MAG TPA: lipopolysaccharide transport periplasmic protein LptA [Thiothrix sp.]|nr:lipopolysaccharide transport periplasmic protein LptA [Thiothrix sp.]
MYKPAIRQRFNRFTQQSLLMGFICCGLVGQAWALSDDVEKPVNIESDTAEFNQEKGTADYVGNVIATQGSLEILASRLNIQAPDGELKTIIAQGKPANFKQQMDDGKLANGKANKMTYSVQEKKIVMTGQAELKLAKDVISSDHIEYFVENGELRAGNKSTRKKGKRVKAIFHPTNKADKPKTPATP